MVTAIVTTVAVTVGGSAWWASRGVPPSAGLPELRQVDVGGRVSVLVVPNRPGLNLVHLTDPGVSVGTDPRHLVTAGPRPGAGGGWAVVRLPPGTGRIWVGRGGALAELRMDTGDGVPGGPDLTGQDGPECASAVLGRLTAGVTTPVASCPDDALSAGDAGALRRMVRFLAQRGTRGITLVEDSSARSAAAAALVRAESAAAGLSVGSPGHPAGPLVAVSGWAVAEGALSRFEGDPVYGRQGAYLAPWLFYAPVLMARLAHIVPLSYAPGGATPLEYVAALRRKAPGEPPSASGYAAWREARGMSLAGRIQLYSMVRVAVPGLPAGHAHTGGAWLSSGSITPVTT